MSMVKLIIHSVRNNEQVDPNIAETAPTEDQAGAEQMSDCLKSQLVSCLVPDLKLRKDPLNELCRE